MLFFLMKMDKQRRLQMFLLALITVGLIPDMVSALQCTYCLAEECKSSNKKEKQNCEVQDFCWAYSMGGNTYKKCPEDPFELDCVMKHFPSGCFSGKKDSPDYKVVLDCMKEKNPILQVINSHGFDEACYCKEDPCTLKGGAGGGGAGGGEAAGGKKNLGSKEALCKKTHIFFFTVVGTIAGAVLMKI